MNHPEHARLQTTLGEPAMLNGIKIKGALRGLLFEATVEQHFSNPTEQHIEMVYTFPLPWHAILLGVDVRLGDKVLSGAIVERKEAEAQYEEAISEGDTAILLEQNRDQNYTLNLGNLAPHQPCLITLRYAQTLQFEQGGLRLLIPTVIAPRFGDPIGDGGLQPHQVTHNNLLADYPFLIELTLHGELTRAQVSCPSHSIAMSHDGQGTESLLTLTLARQASLDRDFVLVIDQLKHDSMAIVAPDYVQPANHVALISFCPRIPCAAPDTTAIKILVDCSGSMAGDSLNAAKRALHTLVQQLRPGEHFALSRFGSDVMHHSRGLWTISDASRLAAQQWIDELQADMGGTEMEKALASTFALAQTEQSDVLLITDGEIHGIARLIETAQQSSHRVFVVGIGSSPSEAPLRRLAESTHAACDFVAPGEAVEPAILRMFGRLRSPRLTDLHVIWPEGIQPDWVNPLDKAIFNGDTINVFAGFKEMPAGQVRLMARQPVAPLEDGTESVAEEIASTRIEGVIAATTAVSRMAAAQFIAQEEQCRSMDDSPQSTSLIQKAVDYQLVTKYTHFLLVHQNTETDSPDNKPDNMPKLHKVAQMLPAGWGGIGLAGAPRPSPGTPRFSGGVLACCISRPEWPSVAKIEPDLTPLAVHTWLMQHSQTDWPKTFQALLDIGLGERVRCWLQWIMNTDKTGKATEEGVVAAFLFVLSHPSTQNALEGTASVEKAFTEIRAELNAIDKRITHHDHGTHTTIDALAETIMCHLARMTADTWPYAVLVRGKRLMQPDNAGGGNSFLMD